MIPTNIHIVAPKPTVGSLTYGHLDTAKNSKLVWVGLVVLLMFLKKKGR